MQFKIHTNSSENYYRKESCIEKEKDLRQIGEQFLYLVAACVLILTVIGGFYHDHVIDRITTIVHQEIIPKGGGSNVTCCRNTSLPLQDEKLPEKLKKLLWYRWHQPNERKPRIFSQKCGNNKQPCTMPCKQPLDSNPEVRLKKLLFNTKLRLSQQQRETILSIGQGVPENDVIIASAVSSNHFYEMQDMFYNLHTKVYPTLKNFSVVVFDIGLTEAERKLTEAKCKCQVIIFPKERFPPHVELNRCFSWKPLIVLAMVEKARKVVVWQDSSTRWMKDIQFVLNRTETFGEQYILRGGASSIVANTIKETFDYVEEMPCAFRPFPELDANIHLHKNDPLVKKAILEPWARCAIEASCMCPYHPEKIIYCRMRRMVHDCHRFDQSGLSILTALFYNTDINKVISPNSGKYVKAKRDSVMVYFGKA